MKRKWTIWRDQNISRPLFQFFAGISWTIKKFVMANRFTAEPLRPLRIMLAVFMKSFHCTLLDEEINVIFVLTFITSPAKILKTPTKLLQSVRERSSIEKDLIKASNCNWIKILITMAPEKIVMLAGNAWIEANNWIEFEMIAPSLRKAHGKVDHRKNLRVTIFCVLFTFFCSSLSVLLFQSRLRSRKVVDCYQKMAKLF